MTAYVETVHEFGANHSVLQSSLREATAEDEERLRTYHGDCGTAVDRLINIEVGFDYNFHYCAICGCGLGRA